MTFDLINIQRNLYCILDQSLVVNRTSTSQRRMLNTYYNICFHHFFFTMFHLSQVCLVTFLVSLNQVWSKNKEQVYIGVVINVPKILLTQARCVSNSSQVFTSCYGPKLRTKCCIGVGVISSRMGSNPSPPTGEK